MYIHVCVYIYNIYIYVYLYIYRDREIKISTDIIKFCVFVVGSYTTSPAGARSLQGYKAKSFKFEPQTDLLTDRLTDLFIVLHIAPKKT